VAFDLPENRVSAGDAALYASPNNERELAQLIARLMDQPEERALLGERSRQRVIQHWRWEIQRDNLIEVYDGLLCLDGASKPRDMARGEAAGSCVSQPPRAAAHITTSVQG
jgi:hypothetical protein